LFPSSKDTDHSLFQGSHHSIISWFCGIANLELGVKSHTEIVLAKLTVFLHISQLAEYLLWACHIHEQSVLNHTILEDQPDTDPRGLTMRELEGLIPANKLSDPLWLDHRHGKMVRYKDEKGTLNIVKGPFRGDRYNEVIKWLK
jgi:hypothetical protein